MFGNKNKLRWIQHYTSEQKMLLVVKVTSFSACLAKRFRSGYNMIAITLHSQDELVRRHWSSADHLKEVVRLGYMVLYSVDVHGMRLHPTLKDMKFDVIVFNLPHSGHIDGFTERDEYIIMRHKELLAGIFKNTKVMLDVGGEVHVTQREDDPCHTWVVKEQAEKKHCT